MKRSKKNIKAPALNADGDTVQQAHPEPVTKSLWQDPFVHILLILATGLVVYLNSVNVPFLFDDHTYLINNPVIKDFNCFPDTRKVLDYAILQDIKNNLMLRPVAYFTFAVNYAIHGLDLFGYHLVNLLLHIGCGMLVYCFFVQLTSTPAMAAEEDIKHSGADHAGYLPLFAALLFVCHPLQTQAVTYIIQRFVPLATFFYLAALVLYVEFRRTSTRISRVWTYVFSLTAALLAMESKEIAFTLPLMMTLVEFMFFRGKITPRLVRLIPFLATMAIIPAKLSHLPSPLSTDRTESVSNVINLVNFGSVSSWDYLMTQFGVITTYLRLLFLPTGQNLDYDYPLQQSFFKPEVLLPLALLLMIAGTGIYLLKRSRDNRLYKLIAFGIFWFFISLSVESSIVPIADLIFEHRAYLPSVGFFIAFIATAAVIFKRLAGKPIAASTVATCLLLLLIVTLSVATILRNMVWKDEVTFWSDVVKKSHDKARTHRGLGEALMRQSIYRPDNKNVQENMVLMKEGGEKQLEAAISEFKEANRIAPKNMEGQIKLAEALMVLNRYDEALRSLTAASELQPKSAMPYVTRGELFESKKEYDRARQEYLKAVEIEPFYHLAHMKLADIYTREGNLQDAVKELQLVLRIFPDEAVRKKLDLLKKR